MNKIKKHFVIIEVENGWLIKDETNAAGGRTPEELWVASDLKDLGAVLTALCSPEKKDEK